MKLSIITITFNNYEELVETCNSLKDISIQFEHVIINGGDCSQTKSFLRRYREDQDVVCISEPDKGIYDAFNKGVLNSTGDYISFLNSGDLLNDLTYYEDAIKLIKNEGLTFVHSGILFDDQKYGKYKLHPKKGDNPGLGMLYMHPSMVVTRTVFDEVGIFNLNYKIAGDFDWACRLWKKKYSNKFTKRYPVLMNNRGVSSQNETQALFECRQSLIKNNLYTGITRIYFLKRNLKYRIRRILGVLDIFRLGKFYKKISTY